jgi:hypothetical protein
MAGEVDLLEIGAQGMVWRQLAEQEVAESDDDRHVVLEFVRELIVRVGIRERPGGVVRHAAISVQLVQIHTTGRKV